MTVDILLELLPVYPDSENKLFIAGYNAAMDEIFKILKANSKQRPNKNDLHFGTKLLKKDIFQQIKSYQDIDPNDIVYVLNTKKGKKHNDMGACSRRLSTGDAIFENPLVNGLCQISYFNHKFQDWKDIDYIMENYIIIDDYLLHDEVLGGIAKLKQEAQQQILDLNNKKDE